VEKSLLDLVHPEDKEEVGFEPTTEGLARALLGALKRGVVAARLRPGTKADATVDFLALHRNLPLQRMEKAGRGAPPGEEPLVSILIVHRDRTKLLTQAVGSALGQDYRNLEVIVVDNGSTGREVKHELDKLEEELRTHTGRMFRLQKTTLGAARNFAAMKARGEYLLFMDDDNVANANEVRVLLTAIRASGADMLAPGNDQFQGTKPPTSDQQSLGRWMPLGPDPSTGFFKDCFGDANHFVSASVFRSLGGFSPAVHPWREDSTGEDWELFARATLQGYHVQVVPFPLYWYRRSASSLGHVSSGQLYRGRTRGPYTQAVPQSLEPLLRLVQGLHHGIQEAHVEQAHHMKMQDLLSTLLCQQFKSLTSTKKEPMEWNLVVNGNFTQGKNGMAEAWTSYGEGYSWFVPSDGYLSMESLEGGGRVMGALQSLLIRHADRVPLLVGARSRAEIDHHSELHADYSLYIDLEYDDGSFSYGYMLPFRGAAEWQTVTGVIFPARPVRMVHMHCMFRYRRGSAHFDDVYIRPLTARDVCLAENATAFEDAATSKRHKKSVAVYRYTYHTELLLPHGQHSGG